MAVVEMCSANNGQSVITLTFDDVTGLLTDVGWTNPTGVWTITFTKSGGTVLTKILNPGDTGSQSIPKGRAMHVATALHEGNDFEFTGSWVG